MTNIHPLEQIGIDAAVVFSTERDNAVATGEWRKTVMGELFASIRESSELFMHSPATVSNMGIVFARECKARGLKPASIKVKKSEFLRIVENIHHVDEDQTSWKGALKNIREATVSREDIIRATLYGQDSDGFGTADEPKSGGLYAKLADLNESIGELLAELRELETGESADDEQIDWPEVKAA